MNNKFYLEKTNHPSEYALRSLMSIHSDLLIITYLTQGCINRYK
jgi:hypothetical protein